jgi:hypothetical protein
MGNLGKLNIVISAVNKTKGVFNSVKKGLNDVKNSVGRALKAFGMLTAGIGALAGGFAVLFKKSFDYLDVIGKIATRTGATTDVIQAFQLSAIQSGASIETANKAIQKFAKMVGEARTGLKTYTDIFDRYNVALLDAGGNERSFNDILKDTMTGLMESQSVFQRNRDLTQLFGRAGQELTNTLMMGGKAFDEYIEKNKTLGLIIKTQAITSAESFNDRLSRLGFRFRVIRDTITTSFLPVLEDMAKGFEEFFDDKNLQTFTRQFVVDFLTALGTVAVAVDSFAKGFTSFFGGLGNIIKGVQVQFLKLSAIGHELADSLSFGLVGSTERAKELTAEADRLFASLAKPPAENTFLTDTVKTINNIRDLFQQGLDEDIKNSFVGPIQQVSEFEKRLQEFAQNAQAPLQTFKDGIGTTGKLIGDTMVASMKKFEDTLVDGLMTGKFAFKDFANFVIKELLRIAIRKLIIDKITGGFGSFLEGFGGKREKGGTVTSNRPYLVGEAGAELFVPNKTGTIVPNNRLGGGMASGGMPVNITYNIQAFDSKDTISAITENAPTISAIIETEFNKRGRRGFVT